jgi:acyl carrier protein
MQSQLVDSRIRDFVLKHFPLAKRNGLRAGEKWLETGMIDSLGILDLVQFIETEFSVKIADDELQPENFESMEAVSKFVRMKAGAKTEQGRETLWPPAALR